MGAQLLEHRRLFKRTKHEGGQIGSIFRNDPDNRLSYSLCDYSKSGISFVTAEKLDEHEVIKLLYNGQIVELEVVWRKPVVQENSYRYGLVTVDQELNLLEVLSD